MFRGGSIMALALALVAAGCGKELVAGGYRDVDAVATGDGTPQSSGRPSTGAVHAVVPLVWSRTALAAAQPQGTISFDARMSLVSQDGEVVPLTRTGTAAQVRIEGTDTALVATGRVQAVSYTRARVVFTRVTANVTGGLSVGGISLTGIVNVGIAPGDSVVVEAPIAMAASGKQTLVVDLDASDWLVASVGGVVPPSVFRSAVDLRVR